MLTFSCTLNFLFVLGKLFWSLEITCKKDSITIEKSDNEIVEAKAVFKGLLPVSLVRNEDSGYVDVDMQFSKLTEFQFCCPD